MRKGPLRRSHRDQIDITRATIWVFSEADCTDWCGLSSSKDGRGHDAAQKSKAVGRKMAVRGFTVDNREPWHLSYRLGLVGAAGGSHSRRPFRPFSSPCRYWSQRTSACRSHFLCCWAPPGRPGHKDAATGPWRCDGERTQRFCQATPLPSNARPNSYSNPASRPADWEQFTSDMHATDATKKPKHKNNDQHQA
jgi:hypothetical protein